MMKHLTIAFFLLIISQSAFAQEILLTEGAGIGGLAIGQSYEEVVGLLGFEGEPKSYDDYVAEELFNENPSNALECQLGFDYYVKYEFLLTLPVSVVFFKDGVVSQIRSSSLPPYYFALAKSTVTNRGLAFWSDPAQIEASYGDPELTVNYDSFILTGMFYFDKGIALYTRENEFRSAHIYAVPSNQEVQAFVSNFQ